MTDDASETPGPLPARNGAPKKLQFHLIKSKLYRVVHADGVYGGVTPNLNVHMSFFSERTPLPKRLAYEILEDGDIGQEDTSLRKAKRGIVREMEVGVLLDYGTAIALRAWLDNQIQAVERQMKQMEDVNDG